jgi:hypothetical protein
LERENALIDAAPPWTSALSIYGVVDASEDRRWSGAMILSERTWLRHANPWSVWTRYAAFPFLVLAIWSHHWIGWWSLLPVATVVLFLYLNPRLFAPPRSTRNWASMAVLGERIWLAEDRRSLPQQLRGVFYALAAAAAVNVLALIWGILSSDVVLSIVTTINVLVGKSWFNDRMVWLYSERHDATPEYKSWLY